MSKAFTSGIHIKPAVVWLLTVLFGAALAAAVVANAPDIARYVKSETM